MCAVGCSSAQPWRVHNLRAGADDRDRSTATCLYLRIHVSGRFFCQPDSAHQGTFPAPYYASDAVQEQTGMSENDVSNMKSSAGSNCSESNHGSTGGVISGSTTASGSSSQKPRQWQEQQQQQQRQSQRRKRQQARRRSRDSEAQPTMVGDESLLERTVPALLQSGKLKDVAQARHLPRAHADEDAPITQFYLGVACGFLDGEASTCAHYEKALEAASTAACRSQQSDPRPDERGSPQDKARALEQARLSAQLQPEVAEMQYQLGVVQMQLSMPGPVREKAARPTNHRTDDKNRAARIAQCKGGVRTRSHRRTPCMLSPSHPWSMLLVPSLRTCLPSARCARAPLPDQAADAYEAALRINPKHMGAYVNGVHCLQMLPPDDSSAARTPQEDGPDGSHGRRVAGLAAAAAAPRTAAAFITVVAQGGLPVDRAARAQLPGDPRRGARSAQLQLTKRTLTKRFERAAERRLHARRRARGT